MPFGDVDTILGARAEYDIPVMPRQLHRRWRVARSHIIVMSMVAD